MLQGPASGREKYNVFAPSRNEQHAAIAHTEKYDTQKENVQLSQCSEKKTCTVIKSAKHDLCSFVAFFRLFLPVSPFHACLHRRSLSHRLHVYAELGYLNQLIYETFKVLCHTE